MRRAALLVVLALVLAACTATGGNAPTPAPVPTTVAGATSTTAMPAQTLLAAGNIASCGSTGDEATAALLDGRPNAVVATLGDNVDNGAATDFSRCYDPTWGRQKARTHPALGNQEYGVFRAGPYFAEFGAAAGDAPLGWYSFDLGAWHVVVLNSNCDQVGCALGGTQETWLRADLAAHPTACALAIWHHPRFTSGTTRGPNVSVAPLFAALYDLGVDVLLTAHEQNYERFAPLNPAGQPDDAKGVREFVVGTGGAGHYPLGPPMPGSEARNDNTFGLLALTLRPTSYQWQFVPEAGKSFTDSGSTNCH